MSTQDLHRQLDALDHLRYQEQADRLRRTCETLYGETVSPEMALSAVKGMTTEAGGLMDSLESSKQSRFAAWKTWVPWVRIGGWSWGVASGVLAWTASHVSAGFEIQGVSPSVFSDVVPFGAHALWVLSTMALSLGSLGLFWGYRGAPKTASSSSRRWRWGVRAIKGALALGCGTSLAWGMVYGLSRYSQEGSRALLTEEVLRFTYDHRALQNALEPSGVSTAPHCDQAQAAVDDFIKAPHTRLGLVLAHGLNTRLSRWGCETPQAYFRLERELQARGALQVGMMEALPWPLSVPARRVQRAVQETLAQGTTRAGWCWASPEWANVQEPNGRLAACAQLTDFQAPLSQAVSLAQLGVSH